MSSSSRRAVVAGSAWAVPAVVLASAAPAFATSAPSCSPWGLKYPGEVRNHAYQLLPDCQETVQSVTMDGWPAEDRGNGWWVERNDSRRELFVVITFVSGETWSGAVGFPPATGHSA